MALEREIEFGNKHEGNCFASGQYLGRLAATFGVHYYF
jgi:hypothetical protein